MPRNGSGVYSVYTPGNPVVAGTTIDPTAFNNTTNDLATALTNSLASNGETPVTANLPMAGFKHTGAGAATVAGQYMTYGQAGNFTNIVAAGTLTGVTSLTMGGALSGVTTLSMGGALTGVTSLTIAGALSGVTTLGMSGALTGVTTVTDSAGNDLGYKVIPRTAAGLIRGQCFATAAGFSISSGTFGGPVAGDACSAYNDSAAAITITQGVGVTLRLAGTTTTGSRTLAPRGFCTLWFNATGECIVSGAGVT